MNASRQARALGVALVLAGMTLAGCQSQPPSSASPQSPDLRQLETPPGGTAEDADRAALARFVGAWSFEGWWAGADGERTAVAGRAAGVIESVHFVLLDLQTTSGEFAGRAGRKSGSLLFASEPGIGLTLTAWGDASPAMNRLAGTVDGAGSVFTFTEARTPAGRHRLGARMAFESDDRWVGEIRDETAAGQPVVARYVFTRVGE